jgi:hypothetical protein
MRMNSLIKQALIILTCFAAVSMGSRAQAYDDGNLGLALLFGYNNFNNRPGVFNNYLPPYFSMHPPVYYGERYYRPYGASPFAAWPQLQANPNYSPRLGATSANLGIIVENPHCQLQIPSSGQSSEAEMPEIVQGQQGPLVIDNPYFEEVTNRYTRVASFQ